MNVIIKCAVSTSNWWCKLYCKNIISARGETIMLRDIILENARTINL